MLVKSKRSERVYPAIRTGWKFELTQSWHKASHYESCHRSERVYPAIQPWCTFELIQSWRKATHYKSVLEIS